MSDHVTTDMDLALVISPAGVGEAIEWLDDHEIAFGLDARYLVFLTNAYEAWKVLDRRAPSERDVVVQAYSWLEEDEELECRDLIRYLRVRGWWVI